MIPYDWLRQATMRGLVNDLLDAVARLETALQTEVDEHQRSDDENNRLLDAAYAESSRLRDLTASLRIDHDTLQLQRDSLRYQVAELEQQLLLLRSPQDTLRLTFEQPGAGANRKIELIKALRGHAPFLTLQAAKRVAEGSDAIEVTTGQLSAIIRSYVDATNTGLIYTTLPSPPLPRSKHVHQEHPRR